MTVAVILAGGQARRMGGQDKAQLPVHGRSLIRQVHDKLENQSTSILVSGHQNYGLSVTVVPDAVSFVGPLAGIYGAHDWLKREWPDTTGFVTVPVDGPNLPNNLIERLTANTTRAAIAIDDNGVHPTFAYWPTGLLSEIRNQLSPNASLRALAELTDASQVAWPGKTHFLNLNTPEEVEAYRRSIAAPDQGP